MEEIDLDNIVGSRTRGKEIDYAQAAKDYPEEEDEDEEDDDDFEVTFDSGTLLSFHSCSIQEIC